MRALAVAAVLLFALAGCGSAPSTGGSSTVTVAGQQVTVPVAPRRVVTLWQPALAGAVRLGMPVVGTVGVQGTADRGLLPYLPAGYPVGDLQIVSNTSAVDDVNIEKVAALKPDLIVGAATTNGKQSGVADKLKSIAPTILLPWKGTGDWRTYFDQLATVFGKSRQAHDVRAEYATSVARLKARIKPVTVSLTRIQKAGEFRVEAPRSFAGGIVADLGMTRPQQQRTPDPGRDYLSLSAEQLGRADADYLFGLPNLSNHQRAAQLTGSPLWPTLRAARSGHAYAVDFDYWSGGNYYAAQRVLADVDAAFAGRLPALR